MVTNAEPTSAAASNALSSKQAESRLEKRWRTAATTGFVAVPNVLLVHYRSLEVTPTEFDVLLNLLMPLWSSESQSFPRVSTIARRMNTSPRTIQRALNRLRACGLIDWTRVQVRDGRVLPGARPGDGVRRRIYDLSRLVDRADRLALDRIQFLAERAERGRHTGRWCLGRCGNCCGWRFRSRHDAEVRRRDQEAMRRGVLRGCASRRLCAW